MSLTADGVWKAGVWASTVWADCVWYEPGCAVTTISPTGGWGWWNLYKEEERKREQQRKRLEQLKSEAQQLDEITKEIALEFRKREEEQVKLEELKRITQLAAQHKQEIQKLGVKVESALAKAIEKETFSAMEALDREIRRAREEELFLYEALTILINQ